MVVARGVDLLLALINNIRCRVAQIFRVLRHGGDPFVGDPLHEFDQRSRFGKVPSAINKIGHKQELRDSQREHSTGSCGSTCSRTSATGNIGDIAMKRLLLSTALVAVLIGFGATGQTTATIPTITAPEGYALQETALTAEQLLGATIYDANGDATGEVEDLVFDAATGAATGAATQNSTTATDGSSGTATGSDTATGTTATATDTTATTSTATTSAADTTAKITHAVLDVGGFLGMGEHRVAVPMDDLKLYSMGTDVRVYLPWTKEQLEAQPSYDPNDVATLGRSIVVPSN